MTALFKKYVWSLCCGFISGVAWQLNYVATQTYLREAVLEILIGVVAVGLGFAVIAVLIRMLVVVAVASSSSPLESQTSLLRYDDWSYTVLLMPLLGSVGLRFDAAGLLVMFLLALGLKIGPAWFVLRKIEQNTQFFTNLWLPLVFALSGFSALIYQVAWQRYLMVLLGVNIESVTLVVCLFMFGLGAGALLGGYLSWKVSTKGTLILSFVCCEMMIGVLGFFSPHLLVFITGNATVPVQTLAVFAMGYLLLPTLFMGATLPLLVSYLKKMSFTVGESVGWLYCGSTVGSAIACFVTSHLLFKWLGLHATVAVAATINLLVVCIVLYMSRGEKQGVLKEAEHV